MKVLVGIAILLVSGFSSAGNIGLGAVIAVKQYDFSSGKYARIYLDSSATHKNVDCIVSGRLYGQITHSVHDEATISRMFSLAMAAYMLGKKVRLYSESGGCEVDLVALQETEF